MREIKNKKVLITGATSGIGRITALTLASLEASVTVFCRDMDKGRSLQAEFEKTRKKEGGSITLTECDLSDFRSVKKACIEFLSRNYKPDILINNAGIWNARRKLSRDDIEETFAVNFLAPYYITREMIPVMRKNDGSRVIFTASGLHQGKINFDDLEFRNSYNGFDSYKQSKLGIILLTRYLAQEPENDGIGFFSVHPGFVNTNLSRDAGFISRQAFTLMGLPVEKGAVTLIYAATADNLPRYSGEYLYLKKVTKTTAESYNMNTAVKLIAAAESYIAKLNSPSGKTN